MSAATAAKQYRPDELAADRNIPVVGTLANAIGSTVLVDIAADVADRPSVSI